MSFLLLEKQLHVVHVKVVTKGTAPRDTVSHEAIIINIVRVKAVYQSVDVNLTRQVQMTELGDKLLTVPVNLIQSFSVRCSSSTLMLKKYK